jgi:serine/threonine-protein phosphatase 2B regulatory subunit
MKFAFSIYDMNCDGYISNGDLFNTLKLLVGENLNEVQIQQIVDRTIIEADVDKDGKLSYSEFCDYVKNMNVKQLFSMKFFEETNQ